jgi:hypothetical protein
VCDYDWRLETSMNLRARVALCITCWSVTLPVAADADKQPWLFVPVSAGGLPAARASAFTGALEAAVVSAGEAVLLNDDAAENIRAYSSEPTEIPPDALKTLKRSLEAEQRELAALSAAAELALEGLSIEQRDAAAQDPNLAQQMEAICLTRLEYDVRMRAGEKAQKHAQLCRALFPALQPKTGAYPPGVLAELGNAPRRDVRVDGPAGCDIVLNGKAVGVAPATLSVFAGPARLQLRCDGRSTRIHPVVLGERERIAIDPALDAALHTDRGLYLTTESVPLAKVAQWLGARVVPLHVQIIDGRLRVQLMAAPFPPAGRTVQRTLWYDLLRGYDEREVSAVTAELLQRGHNPSPPLAVATSIAAAPARRTTRSAFSVPTGAIIVGGTGVALLAGGLVTGLMGQGRDAEIRRFGRECTAPCDPPPEQRAKIKQLQSEVKTLYTTTNILIVVGGVSVVAAVGWVLLWPKAADSDRVSFTPFASPSEAGARIAGRF